MGFMTIDGKQVEFTDEPNVLSVIRKADIDIPTLCYHSELSVYGACRLCTVENEKGKTFASCSEKPKDGMVVYTNTPRLMKYRKMILELLLAAHDRDCTTCIKSGECHLQELAHRMGVTTVPYKNRMTHHEIDASSPSIIRNPNKCILCGDCVRMCDNVQAVNAIDFTSRGTSATVAPAFNKLLNTTDCVGCGQCRVVCPTGAISINTNMDPVWEALADPDTKVIAQIAPAVRVAVGDAFDLPQGENVMGKIVNVLHRMGFDEVFDTAYGADLTVIEESEEFLQRLATPAKICRCSRPAAPDGSATVNTDTRNSQNTFPRHALRCRCSGQWQENTTKILPTTKERKSSPLPSCLVPLKKERSCGTNPRQTASRISTTYLRQAN